MSTMTVVIENPEVIAEVEALMARFQIDCGCCG